MAKSHKKITITLPIELDATMSALVKASKETSNPITKSSLIVVAVCEYLAQANAILKAQKSKEEC